MNKCASCGGTIEDGYCTVCGLAAAPAAVPSSSAPSFPSTSGGSSASGSSSGSLVSGSPSTTFGGSTRSGSRRGSRRSSGRSSRGRLGAGLVEIPPVPYRDPSTAVLANPQVPENRRYCGNCGHEVGRGRDGRAGLAEGFCRNCGTRFSFTPKLVAGDLVGGQYEVLGCLAFGGLGWIYLARDHNVSDRWVVLKGLLNTGDPDAMEAAVAERQFLAQVEHPNIVRIYNFVQHGDAGYIVMEYVGGKSLKDIRRPGPVPVSHALAYAIEVLPALGYLHDRGLVYCDFKPDNVIQTEEQLKLIDMGGVRAIDGDGAIYGTVGYQAPEIETEGPSVSSDLFTIGRALAVLTFDFHGYQTTYKYTLPGDIPLLAEQESFARLLRRATSADPDRRFDSAGEMAEQLTGVLREVLSVADGKPRPAFSNVFSPELAGIGTGTVFAPGGRPPGDPPAGGKPSPQTPLAGGKKAVASLGSSLTLAAPGAHAGANAAVPRPSAAEVISGLPMPQVDRTSPAAGFLATFAGLDPVQRAAALTRAVAGDGVPPEVATSAETGLALVRALLDSGDAEAAGGVLADLAARDPLDWRIAWYDGLRRLATGAAAADPGQSSAAAAASGAFSAVYDELPGELAPKLALGFAAEAVGDAATAGRYFRLVWTVDKSYISAAFGLARACLAAGDRPTAIAALAAVPETSSHHAAAQIAAVRILVSPGVSGDDLRAADSRLGRLALDEGRRQQLTIEILRAALDWASASRGGSGRRSAGTAAPGPGQSNAAAVGPGQSNTAVAGGGKILGYEPNERALRFGLEQGYRALARLTPDRERRIQLVDLANEVRPRTWT